MENFGLSLKRVCEISGVPSEVVRTSLKDKGHWRLIVPRKLPNGRLLFDAVAVFKACGKLPKTPPGPAEEIRDHICSHTGAELFQGHLFSEYLTCELTRGDTFRDRKRNLLIALRHERHIQSALAAQVRNLMLDEESLTEDDWRRFNYEADLTEETAKHLCTPLRWHLYKPVKADSTTPRTVMAKRAGR